MPNRIYYKKFLFQIIMILLYVFIVLLNLDTVTQSTILWAIGAGSLTSSAYIAFINPEAPVSDPYKIIGSYIIALSTALILSLILTSISGLDVISHLNNTHIFWFSAAISVIIAVVMMIALGYEHPPAAGVALVAVIDVTNYNVLLVILLNALILATIKLFTQRYLIDLVVKSSDDQVTF